MTVLSAAAIVRSEVASPVSADAWQEPKAVDLSHFGALLICDLGFGPSPLSKSHWLMLWLNRTLSGALTGAPVNLVEKPSVWPFRAHSLLTRDGSRVGYIYLEPGTLPGGAQSVNQAFVDQWYIFLFEIGNLMVADRYHALWHKAVAGEVSEFGFAVQAISLEVEASRIACALFRSLIHPLLGEKRVPQGCLWKGWEEIHSKNPIPPKDYHAWAPAHFNFYRQDWKRARRFRAVGDQPRDDQAAGLDFANEAAKREGDIPRKPMPSR